MAGEKFRTVLLFGVPGVGKGTQGRILSRMQGLFVLACGEVFRSFDPGSEIGVKVASYTSKGELVPDELTVKLWQEAMRENISAGWYKPESDLLILDGIPRSVAQAKYLDDSIEVLGILHLTSSNENAMIERLKRRALAENRADDADENVIRHRFEVYHQQSQPVLDYYPRSLRKHIEALATPEEVAKSIQRELAPIREKHFGKVSS
ncbi:MAG: adenylate kinase family protein [Planctomycetaceae bacterium]